MIWTPTWPLSQSGKDWSGHQNCGLAWSCSLRGVPWPSWNLYQKPVVRSGSLINAGGRCGGAAEKAAGEQRTTTTHRRIPLMNMAHEVHLDVATKGAALYEGGRP